MDRIEIDLRTTDMTLAEVIAETRRRQAAEPDRYFCMDGDAYAIVSRECEDENTQRCKRIAEEVEAYVNGEIWIDGNGNTKDAIPDQEPQEGWRVATLMDYFEETMGVWTILNQFGDVTAVRIMVEYGGPNVYIDSESGAVELYWGTSEAKYNLSYEAQEAITEWGVDYFKNMVLPEIKNGGAC